MTEHASNTGRRNALVLACAQAVNGSIGTVAIALGGLAGAYLLPGNLALATLPVACYSIGTAIFALPTGLITKKYGRRRGFTVGAIIGIFGALLTYAALANTQFLLFCLGFIFLGGSSAFVQQYRFAAADQGSEKFKARAISWVLTGGVFAAIIGPNTALRTKDLLAETPFGGAFLAVAGLLCIGIFILSFLRPVPAATAEDVQNQTPPRALSEIMKNPVFIVALICAVSAYGLMAFMMTSAPLAMTNHGHSHADAVLGIQWHVMAMFAPSFFTGILINKFGKSLVIGAGLILLLTSAVTALAGLALWNFWASLVFLGVGWNFAFIGATALLGETYAANEKNIVQGAHDFILFSLVASGSLLAGVTLNTFGWNGVAIVLIPGASMSLAALIGLTIYKRKQNS